MDKNTKRGEHGLKERYIFFILLSMLLIPSSFFVIKSYTQLNEVLQSINKNIELNTTEILSSPYKEIDPKTLTSISRISLEHDVMKYRHHRTTAYLATRTWMRFMSLIFGAVLITIGSGFVLGRINASKTEGEVSFKDFVISITTSSPGIILVICGLVLIAIPNLSSQRINTNDTSTYISKQINNNSNYEKNRFKALKKIREKHK